MLYGSPLLEAVELVRTDKVHFSRQNGLVTLGTKVVTKGRNGRRKLGRTADHLRNRRLGQRQLVVSCRPRNTFTVRHGFESESVIRRGLARVVESRAFGLSERSTLTYTYLSWIT